MSYDREDVDGVSMKGPELWWLVDNEWAMPVVLAKGAQTIVAIANRPTRSGPSIELVYGWGYQLTEDIKWEFSYSLEGVEEGVAEGLREMEEDARDICVEAQIQDQVYGGDW